MKLYSSTFISIVLAFLMFLSKNGQPIVVAEDPVVPEFSYQLEQEESIVTEKIRIEIFENMTCMHCTDFVLKTLTKLRDLEQETDEIDLHLYFIPDINDEILHQAAMSLKCAADQEGFWGMYEKIHENKENLNRKSFIAFGKDLELNVEALSECMKEAVHQKTIEEDVRYASEQNINVKPTILINEYRLIGNQPFENIQKIINDFLKEKQRAELESELFDQSTDLGQELETIEFPTTDFQIN